VVTHWIAGFLTNFKNVARRHYFLVDFFYPLAFFSFSSNSFWVREAFKVKVPTIALSSSFSLVGSGVLYFIPANLRYYSTLFFFFRVFSGSLLSVTFFSTRFLQNKKPFLQIKKRLFLVRLRKLFSYFRWYNFNALYNSLFFLRVSSSSRRAFSRRKVNLQRTKESLKKPLENLRKKGAKNRRKGVLLEKKGS